MNHFWWYFDIFKLSNFKKYKEKEKENDALKF